MRVISGTAVLWPAQAPCSVRLLIFDGEVCPPELAALLATANRGYVLQTHLFHDRIMPTGTLPLRAGATLGPHSVILPAAVISEGTTDGPASLILRAERLQANTYWLGNPTVRWNITSDQPVKS